MTTKAKLSGNKDYWVMSLFMFTLFICWSFTYSMFAIWLNQSAGLSGTQVGIIFSLNAASAMFIQPMLGYIQDKIQEKQHILWLNILILMTAGAFFEFVYKPLLVTHFYWGAIVGAVYMSFVFLAIAGAIETYIERILRLNGMEFGAVRTWGSLGWASAAFFAGRFINIDPELNFWMTSALATVPAAILLFVKIRIPSNVQDHFNLSTKVAFSDVTNLFKLKDFYFLMLYVLGVSSIYITYDQQFPVFFASMYPSVEEGNTMYGNLNSAQVFLEAIVFLLAPRLVNGLGAKNGLILAGSIMVLRIYGSALVESLYLLSAIKILHAIELPILMVSMFKYLNGHFDDRLSSTLYLVGFALVTQVGTIIFSPIAGIMYDAIGFKDSYIMMASVSAVFLFVSMKLLISNPQPSEKAVEA